MKAVLCKAFGPAETLVLEEIASPAIKKNEILLDVHAAGVNFPDTLIIEGKYQFKPPFPFSPGGEAAGVVSDVGEKVSHLKVGDRVMALTGWGSFAEQVAVPGYNVLPIPQSMDFNTAAAFSMTYGTSMHALKQRANLQPGETLLVLGASGGAQDQQGFAGLQVGPLFQRVHGRAVGHAERGGRVEVHALRDRQHVIARHRDLFGKAAPAGQRHDPVTDFEVADFFAHVTDHACRFATRREREGRLELVLALDNQGVREVDPGGMHVQQDFVLLDRRAGDLFQHQGFGGAEGFAQHSFHRTIPFGVVADKCRRVCPWVNEHARA